jgi:hypothetical protein
LLQKSVIALPGFSVDPTPICSAFSFDHLVGERQQHGWHRKRALCGLGLITSSLPPALLVPHPLPTRDGGVLHTVRDARACLLALPLYRELRNHWQRACQLILEEADVEAVSQQFRRALFMDGKLDIRAFERISGVRSG